MAGNGDLCDVGINSVVPVEEALSIDDIADLEVLDSLVNIGGVVAKIRLNGK